jgi:hypothetical protein
MSGKPIGTVRICWLSLEEGGRKNKPAGEIYFANARFSEQGEELFSVVLRPLSEKSSPVTFIGNTLHIQWDSLIYDYDLDFFAPELVVDQLIEGKKIWITEGPRNVAEGIITAVEATLIQQIRQQHTSPV